MTDDSEITYTVCPTCGTWVPGVRGRFACAMCGWLSAPEDWPERPEPEDRSESPEPEE